MTRKHFSACWGNSPIPLEQCLRHRAAHPFRMLLRQFLPEKKVRCNMSITPTLHRTFHHRLLCLFSAAFPIWFCGILHRNIGIKTEQSNRILGMKKPRKHVASGVFVHFEVSIISWRTAAHGELPSSRTSFSPSFSGLS